MITDDPAEFAAALEREGRLIGIDLGTKTIGLALSDLGRTIATPMQTLKRGKFSRDAETLLALCKEHGITGLVIGLPINMNGTEGPRAQSTRAFAANIAGKFALPILMWDERLSTSAVTRAMIDADLSRKRRAEIVDQAAAGFILQGALDALAHRA